MAEKVTSSGITTNSATGERYIPSSVRADGSKRKEIRVRPGYKPPEDVELYRNRAAAAWKNRERGGVPGPKEARRKAKEADASTEKKGSDSDNWRVPADKPAEESSKDPVDAEAEAEKKARNLKKKLRQARELRDKKSQGESLLPEQLEKVIKIQELVRQLDALGFDHNGDKKEGAAGESV
ncbi:hypothetical protein N7470_000410 [Penicillium chermesinum]|nr:hypothetical protein N7470_000410 [Penicillium chermesinum]